MNGSFRHKGVVNASWLVRWIVDLMDEMDRVDGTKRVVGAGF